ncbi:MAG: ATP-binding cassette domain-containing protein [Smithella sp.]
MSSENIAIRVNNLSKCYQIYDQPNDRLKQSIYPRIRRLMGMTPGQYYREFWALRDISFEVIKGRTVGIIGRNGSGKSTLLQLICGTISPTTGSVETHGRVAALLELGSGFNPDFTGRENVFMNGAILGLSQEEINARFEDIAAFADIGDFIEQPVKTYSSGMLVRLAFAVSVCVDPDILIIDEALAVGDAAFQFKCLDRLRILTSGGTTVLFVSHDVSMMKNFCHQVLYLQEGRERARGAPEEMAERYYMDMRDEQRRYAAAGKHITVKPFLGEKNGIAFGTEEGQILSASFTNSQGLFSSYMKGEEIEVRIEAKHLTSLPNPYISLIIHDRRMMDVGGSFFPLNGILDGEGWKKGAIIARFSANLAAGRYHITVRLEDRASETVFQPIDKQAGLLSFEVIEKNKTFLGTVDLGIHTRSKIRIVALLTVRNEALYLDRCLRHLYEQGIETCVIDNESTDSTLEIAHKYLGHAVFRIETQPFPGFYDWTNLLSYKAQLSREIDADWFIHLDADEIREAPTPFKSLYEGILQADQEGYNAINFDEFIFLPTSDDESFEGTDYVEKMQYYYFFEPIPLRQIKAWKNTGQTVDIVSSGGHSANFEGRKIYPDNFILRHYIVLSRAHAIAKYGNERIYSREEVEQRGWHGTRATFSADRLVLPSKRELKTISANGWDRSQPWAKHTFLGNGDAS